MNEQVRKVYISKEQQQLYAEFSELYDTLGYQGTLETNRGKARKLKKNTVVCRFCKKKRPGAKFTQDTHLISNLLGQNNFFSIDECNTCNQSFKRAENDLAASLGVSRTIDHIRSDVKAPGFQSAGGGVTVKNLGNNFVWVQNTKPGNGEFEVDLQNGKASISLESQKYIPENIYRALLKMGLGNLPTWEVESYEAGFKVLADLETMTEFNRSKNAIVTKTKIILARPFGLLFQKKPGIIHPNLPQHIFCLYCLDQVFQISLPGYQEAPINEFENVPIAPYVQFDVANPLDDIILSYRTDILSSSSQDTSANTLSMRFPTENLVAIPLGLDIGEWLNNLSKGRSKQ